MTCPEPRPPASKRLAAALIAVAAGLAGCGKERVALNDHPEDYRVRHPIVVTRAPHRLDLDIGPEAFGLNDRERAETLAFASRYRKYGEGPVAILLPAGTANEASAQRALPEIRTVLHRAGIGGELLDIRAYSPADGIGVAPVRISYTAPKAVTQPCGMWPDDVAGDQRNRSYYNFGCAYQQNLAAMVADPRDLAGPRPEGRAYASRRETVLEKYGKGEDPSTTYRSEQKGAVSKVGQQ
jgi:pilus assembly protein CpaD